MTWNDENSNENHQFALRTEHIPSMMMKNIEQWTAYWNSVTATKWVVVSEKLFGIQLEKFHRNTSWKKCSNTRRWWRLRSTRCEIICIFLELTCFEINIFSLVFVLSVCCFFGLSHGEWGCYCCCHYVVVLFCSVPSSLSSDCRLAFRVLYLDCIL